MYKMKYFIHYKIKIHTHFTHDWQIEKRKEEKIHQFSIDSIIVHSNIATICEDDPVYL